MRRSLSSAGDPCGESVGLFLPPHARHRHSLPSMAPEQQPPSSARPSTRPSTPGELPRQALLPAPPAPLSARDAPPLELRSTFSCPARSLWPPSFTPLPPAAHPPSPPSPSPLEAPLPPPRPPPPARRSPELMGRPGSDRRPSTPERRRQGPGAGFEPPRSRRAERRHRRRHAADASPAASIATL